MQAQVYNLDGQVVDTLELSDYIFGIEPNMAVLHQAVVRQQANSRLGTHNTKTRADVRGGGKKPYRQKGTGNARQGSRRSPQWRGGGVIFGPHPRSYEQDMPRKMRRLAMRSALSAKARDGQIVIVNNLDELEPRTKAMTAMLGSLNLDGKRTLVMLPERMDNVYRAASNITNCKLTFAQYLSIVDMLKYDRILFTVDALDAISFLNDTDEPLYSSTANNADTLKTEAKQEQPVVASSDDVAELYNTADDADVADTANAAADDDVADSADVAAEDSSDVASPAAAGDKDAESEA